MKFPLPLLGAVLWSAAVGAQSAEPLIQRPLTLRAGEGSLTLHGTYTNWDFSNVNAGLTEPGPSPLAGETLAAGVDFGVTDQVQLGLAVALPVHPGFAFGSILGGASLALDPHAALRLDAGYERVGVNGADVRNDHVGRYFGGLGLPLKVSFSSAVAFVSGRTGAVQFGHFNNMGSGGTGIYFGVGPFTDLSTDILVFEGGSDNSGTSIGFNLPVGLLVQPDPHFAFTLQAGYSAVIVTSGTSAALHYLPIGLEAVLSPVRALDLGVRFSFDGYVAHSGDGRGLDFGYFDTRALMFWLRLQT
ncbi:MAG TPA: hypothetical protein VFE90_15795 [Myxococcales bacterium]|jgi:hypothetical protein|nr:hypothetical protein [Myxococcales bacterium]